MAGTKAGALKTREKNLAKDPDFYSKLGKKGAAVYNQKLVDGTAKPRGFQADKDLARRAGAIGGAKSKRGAAKTNKVHEVHKKLEAKDESCFFCD